MARWPGILEYKVKQDRIALDPHRGAARVRGSRRRGRDHQVRPGRRPQARASRSRSLPLRPALPRDAPRRSRHRRAARVNKYGLTRYAQSLRSFWRHRWSARTAARRTAPDESSAPNAPLRWHSPARRAAHSTSRARSSAANAPSRCPPAEPRHHRAASTRGPRSPSAASSRSCSPTSSGSPRWPKARTPRTRASCCRPTSTSPGT